MCLTKECNHFLCLFYTLKNISCWLGILFQAVAKVQISVCTFWRNVSWLMCSRNRIFPYAIFNWIADPLLYILDFLLFSQTFPLSRPSKGIKLFAISRKWNKHCSCKCFLLRKAFFINSINNTHIDFTCCMFVLSCSNYILSRLQLSLSWLVANEAVFYLGGIK